VHGVGRVSRGDLVLVRSAEVGRLVVKRAIGLPGDQVELDGAGVVRIDGRALAEPYARRAVGPAGQYAVPAGTIFVLGDNRAASSDSRVWRRPYLPEDAVAGRVLRFPR
jgi:signal peptidase I